MSTLYRALISIPIDADDDEEAIADAAEAAYSLKWPGRGISRGHLEWLIQGGRVVEHDPDFESMHGIRIAWKENPSG